MRPMRLTSQGDDLLLGMHNGRVSRDRSSYDIIRVGKVNNHDLVLLSNFLAHANESVRLEC
jgi:hypothetical protein